ncbi:MAG: manganese efflux pump, partial [Coriobacteriaceae bacterium]|nr:manganese efflux pump [Coriobacteriaceae bacterium]
MGIFELLLIAVGVSMDAFAVSICRGLGMRSLNLRTAVVLALFFGGFQALMPLMGWALGSQLMWIISPVDHWVAFALLALIGGKTLWEAFHGEEGCGCEDTSEIDPR